MSWKKRFKNRGVVAALVTAALTVGGASLALAPVVTEALCQVSGWC